MKILFLSQEFPPATAWGGIGTYAGIVTRALVRQGAEVHVLSVVPGQRHADADLDGVHVHLRPLRRPRGVGRLLRAPQSWGRVSLAAAVLHHQHRLGVGFDVCESPEWWAEGLGVALRGRLPLVVRLHSGAAQVFPHTGDAGIDARLAVRCEEALIRRADVVTGTRPLVEAVAAQLRLPPARLRPIPLPVERRQPAADPARPPQVLFAGRLEPRKGPDTLLRAAPAVLTQRPDTRFLLLGADADGPDGRPFRETLEGIVRELGIGHAVEMPGRRGGPETVAAELARSTLCAMPSRWESMGYVAAEAAALGRPVVASRIPALEAIVEDGVTGRLVEAEDVDGWAAAILELLAMSKRRRRRMGEAGARLVAARCGPDLVADQTLAAYEEAIRRRRTGRER
jgi:glycogen synthase